MRTKTGALYRAGLAVVAFAMVLLPLIYLGLIALATWGVLYHLANDTWILRGASGRAALVQLTVYLAPAVAGGILIFFMVKPFFAAKSPAPDTLILDLEKEPLLVSFVHKICTLVGAPAPSRIDVDCQVNASASLSRGLWSKDLVLTIGLPLASGLAMREFAGVLAHEFGHFAQGAGMRLTYVIRKINFWFARVVYERDAWDVKLERTAKGIDWRIGIVLHSARGCVWLTRRILWVLMQAGNGISCFMLRQMEFDADSYEAKIAGSDAFESTTARVRVLNVATQFAYEDVRQNWASHRLPENLPLLINHKAVSLPADIHQKLSASAHAEKTGWFDTHPCDADRIRAVRRLGEPGVFRVADSAAGLFADFGALSRMVTRHQFEKHLELEFTDENLMSAEEMLRESAASTEADAMIQKFFGSVNISIASLIVRPEMSLTENRGEAIARWRAAQATVEMLRADAEVLSRQWTEQQSRLGSLISGRTLAKAGFQIDPKEFELPAHVTQPVEQESAARMGLEEAGAIISTRLAKLEPFHTALRDRVALALSLAGSDSRALTPEHLKETSEFSRLLAAVAAEIPRARDMGLRLNAFLLLAQNRRNHSEVARVDEVMNAFVAELVPTIKGIQERLTEFTYPFSHARGRLTVAEYARADESSEHLWQQTYIDGSAHVDRLFALHYRLVGRVLAAVDAIENHLEKEES
ncbi:MAG: hypothetical protein QOF48_487 [Verrucomicrobiota bacterium]